MPQVPPRSQVKRSGQKANSDIGKSSPQDLARDDLRTAYAGDKNRGPAGKISKAGKTTHDSGRRLRDGSGKTPVR